jgi:beta-carotene 3-hydroxylase
LQSARILDVMIAGVVFVVSFVAMEGVSYSAHRWVMHGHGMAWHASHHAPPRGRLERNDLFPVCFSVFGIALSAVAFSGAVPAWVQWAAAGVAAYGVAYLVVHELFIHRRLSVPMPRIRYFRWLRDSHRNHHLDGGEPFGMLLPLRRRTPQAVASPDGDRPADDPLPRRASARDTRARL